MSVDLRHQAGYKYDPQIYDLGRQKQSNQHMQALSPVDIFSENIEAFYQSDKTGLSIIE